MLKPHNSGGQPWYRSSSINDSSFSKSKGLNYLRRLNVEIWHNMQKFVLHFLCKMHHYSGLVCSCSVPAPPFHGKRCLFVVSPLTSSITWPECEVLRLSMSSQWKVTAEVLTDKHSSKLQLSIVQTIWDLSPNAFSVIITRFVLHYYNYAYRKDLTNIHILRYRDCEKKTCAPHFDFAVVLRHLIGFYSDGTWLFMAPLPRGETGWYNCGYLRIRV